MSLNFQEWCETTKDVTLLIRKMKSSLPEQYIGFYLSKVFGSEIEYQKQFDWLGKHSLDIYIPSLQLAIEYDGTYYHANKKTTDVLKTERCRSYGIFLIHIVEKKANQEKSRKRNEVNYYFQKNYKNIDVAFFDLVTLINKRYNMSIQSDVDLARDQDEIISYIQQKFYKKSMAYIWPESEDYWLDEENGLTRFDLLSTDGRWLYLKCPHCGRKFRRHMRYYSNRKSFVPCECEYQEIENSFNNAIKNYIEKGEIVVLDRTLHSRRLYDRMAEVVDRMWHCKSIEEAELYKKLGFTSPHIDVYLELYKDKT